ncbi:hypothetical protein [Rhodococcoides fascians]|uniref:hypothetical protein n=1 Tax=Rhodococcoides fascians TaxID=1828 RepID=UPI00050BE244|nr:hypothetical protein [Rhodococcus fascians]
MFFSQSDARRTCPHSASISINFNPFGIDIDKLQSSAKELAASAQANPTFSGVDLDAFTEESSELESRYPALKAYPILEVCGLAIENDAPEWLTDGIEAAAGDNPTLRDYLSHGYEVLCPSIFSAETVTAASTATETESNAWIDCGPLTIESGSGRLTLPVGNYTCDEAETVLFDSLSAPSQPDRRVKEVTIDGHDWQCGVGGADEPYLCSTTGGDEIEVEFEYDAN